MQGKQRPPQLPCHPVRELAEIVKKHDNTVLIVDRITAVGVYDIPMDSGGIGYPCNRLQKALMLPPGLAFVGVSDKAWKFNETAKCPRFYFDLKERGRKNLKDNTTAYTPLLTNNRPQEVLKAMKEEDLKISSQDTTGWPGQQGLQCRP